jgi:hypothetical protein
MALVAPNVGEVILLRYMLNHTAATDVEMRLYNNNHTPVEADVLGSYTQASAAGYTAVSLPGVNWTVSTSLGTTTGEHSETTFSFTTSATIYGYYVTDDAATGLLWSERFTGAPFNIPSGGGTIAVTPRITLE